jgi:hypothetical protein
MTTAQLVATHSFSQAKAHLSDVMSEVVRQHHPTVIERNHGKEMMLLLPMDDLQQLLGSFNFSTLASVSDGEFVLRLPELNLIAGGETFEDAVDELESLAVAYAQQFFSRPDFYMQTDRAVHMPYLLRLAVTPPEERRALLVPAPEPAAAVA